MTYGAQNFKPRYVSARDFRSLSKELSYDSAYDLLQLLNSQTCFLLLIKYVRNPCAALKSKSGKFRSTILSEELSCLFDEQLSPWALEQPKKDIKITDRAFWLNMSLSF